MKDKVEKMLEESIAVKKKMLDSADLIADIAALIADAYKFNKKVIIFGNGGSAADAQHIAGELVGKFFKIRKALPAVALNTNTSIITALANDFGYDIVFRRQLEAIMVPGDVVIGISTSGSSKNMVEALKYAKENGARTVAFTGARPCPLDGIADYVLKIPSESTPRIQEGHITAGHIICALVEELLF